MGISEIQISEFLALEPKPSVFTLILSSCNAPNFAVNFFFLFFTRQNSGVTFPFLFPSLNLDLFQSSSGIRFGFPV
jgi:hypothetical protein